MIVVDYTRGVSRLLAGFAIRQIAAAHPHMCILVVTMFEDADSVFAAMRAGAGGYVLKDMDDDERYHRAAISGARLASPGRAVSSVRAGIPTDR